MLSLSSSCDERILSLCVCGGGGGGCAGGGGGVALAAQAIVDGCADRLQILMN